MRDIVRMLVVLSVICGISGFALSYLKQITTVPIEEQVLKYVQEPVLKRIFANVDNSPVADRQKFTLKDGSTVMVFPAKKDAKLVGVAMENSGTGFGGDINVMVGFNPSNDTLVGIGVTTMKETPGIGDVILLPRFTDQFIGKPKDVKLKKDGGSIDAISGATVSSGGTTLAVSKAATVYAELKEQILKAWPEGK